MHCGDSEKVGRVRMSAAGSSRLGKDPAELVLPGGNLMDGWGLIVLLIDLLLIVRA